MHTCEQMAAEDPKDQRPVILCEYSHAMVPWCKLTPVDASVESAWFQRLDPYNDELLPSFSFKFNLKPVLKPPGFSV